jgi:hypothetical protein
MKAEWKSRADFAEFAEAIGVTTDMVIAVGPDPHSKTVTVVFYTPEKENLRNVWSAILVRDEDGIWSCREKREVPDFMANLEAAVQKQKEEMT